MSKHDQSCEICGAAQVRLSKCQMCGALVCDDCMSIEESVCLVCTEARCQICGQYLSSRACNICGRLVCEDHGTRVGEATICDICKVENE